MVENRSEGEQREVVTPKASFAQKGRERESYIGKALYS
jgi:hypothetical protein